MTTHPLHRSRRIRSRVGRAAGTTVATGPRVVPLVFYTLLVIALFFAMIYLRIALDRTAFELDTIERAITLEQSRQLDLRLSIAELQDPVRIASEAERIGMTTPDERIPIVISGTRGVADPIPDDEPIRALPGQRP